MFSKNDKTISYIVIVIIAIILSIPLMKQGMYVSHDGDFHISRTIGTIEQLQAGESPLIISRFSNNLGFGWNLFYPPITTLINVILAIVTNSGIIAIKLFIFLTFAISGMTMFNLVDKITSKNRLSALMASIMYMIAPYRILNVYTRLAVGEMAGAMFIPIIFEGIYLILKGETNKEYIFVLGVIALILSHNITTMLVFILGLAYLVVNIKALKNKQILKTLCICTFIIILSVLFFEVPILEQKQAANYEVFRGKMYTRESVQAYSLSGLQLILRKVPGTNTEMYFIIGLPILLAVLLTPITIKRIEDKVLKKIYKFFLIAGIVSVFMSTNIFPWKIMPDILLMIQFPWRLLLIIIFCFSLIAGINIAMIISLLKEKTKKELKAIPILFIILSLLYSLTLINHIENRKINDDFFREEEVIDQIWETSKYSSYIEYWPEKAAKAIGYVSYRDQKVFILAGKANIKEENKEKGKLEFIINEVEENTILELPYLYYKGYEIVYTNGVTKEKLNLPSKESERGLLQLDVNSDIDGKIEVQYHATTLHKICIAISFTTIIIYIVCLTRRKILSKYQIKSNHK